MTDQEPTTTKRTATIYRDTAGEWRWRVQAGNNEIISEGEGYEQRGGAIEGLGGAHAEFSGGDFSDVDHVTVEAPRAHD